MVQYMTIGMSSESCQSAMKGSRGFGAKSDEAAVSFIDMLMLAFAFIGSSLTSLVRVNQFLISNGFFRSLMEFVSQWPKGTKLRDGKRVAFPSNPGRTIHAHRITTNLFDFTSKSFSFDHSHCFTIFSFHSKSRWSLSSSSVNLDLATYSPLASNPLGASSMFTVDQQKLL